MCTLVYNERGSATILTILVSAVMITVGVGFNWMVKEHLEAAEGLKAKAEAMVEARSAYNTIIYSILNGSITQKDIILPPRNICGVDKIPIGSVGIKIKDDIFVAVQDSNSLISVVSPNTEALKRLIKVIGGREDSAAFIDSFIDWVDTDDLSHVNGAESQYYSAEGKPYKPRNFPIQYKDEMGFMKGTDSKLYEKIEPYLTMLPSFGFNPNTADDPVLMAYMDIDKEGIENLRSYIAKKPISSDAELFAVTGKTMLRSGEMGVYYHPSPYLEITVKAGSPRTIYTLHAGVDTRQKNTSPLSVIYWKEG